MTNRQHWETEASNWVSWARTPGHDAYWHYRDSFFEHVVPPPGRLTVELGCGEGRVTRDLISRGHSVIAIDGSASLLRHVSGSDDQGRYVLSDAVALPLATASVDQVIAYNSLMDMDDLGAALAEIGRILKPGSVFSICVTHPLFEVARPVTDSGPARMVIDSDYFGSRRFDATVEKRHIQMHFRGWSHSLEVYATALSQAGFLIETLREPVPYPTLDEYEVFSRYPMFLHVRALKR